MSAPPSTPDRPSPAHAPSYPAAVAMNLVAVLCWAVAPTMVKAINRSFPVNFQNAWRYLVSLAVLWPVAVATADRSRLRADLAEIRRLAGKVVVIALVQYAFQFTYTYSLTFIYPGVMTLVGQTQAIFGALVAVALFPDERRVVRDYRFLAGIACAIAGAVLVVLGSGSLGGASGGAAFGAGVLSVLASAVAWALLGALIKRWVPHVPSLLAISSVFTVLVPMFLASYAAANRGFPVPAAPAVDWVLMVASGLVGVGLGQSLFYRAVPVIGVATSTSLGLLIPFLAAGLSWLVFRERLSAVQLVGGVLLVLGSWFVVRLRLRLRG